MMCFVSAGKTSLDGQLDFWLLVHVQEKQSWTKWTFGDGSIRLRESSLKRLQQEHKFSGRGRVKVRVLKPVAQSKNTTTCQSWARWSVVTNWIGDHYVLPRLAPALKFLHSQILCRLYKTSFGWDYKSRSPVCVRMQNDHITCVKDPVVKVRVPWILETLNYTSMH